VNVSGLELFVIKFIVTTAIVLILSFVAEHVSPKWAGILSGFPTGSAITLHFYGLENGLEFAGRSAIYNMVGLVAMQSFIFSYYIGGLAVGRFKVLVSICFAILGYATAIILLSRLTVTPLLALAIPIVSFPIFRIAFRKIGQSLIVDRIALTWKVILGRAGLAALTICLITGIAKIVGPAWAGLFSAFPTTLFPLILIIHLSYGERYAHSIIKHVPEGLGSLLAYSLILYLSYPTLSLYAGIAVAFAGSLVYLLAYRIISRKLRQEGI